MHCIAYRMRFKPSYRTLRPYAFPVTTRVAWSVLCDTIFSNPCAGCGALVSAVKAPIRPICTTCAAQVRSGTPNTPAWLRKQTTPAGQSPASNIGKKEILMQNAAAIQKEIRIGIVGADTKASWAKVSHVPAINGLAGLKLDAVATRNEQSARQAAEAFGADRWFSDPFAMIRDERIDAVTIAVKVPAHRELVLAALEAGKAVYCEAPLGRTVAETEEMARAGGSLHTAIGLQGRLNPAVRRAARLVSSGKIGQPLTATVFSATVGFGPEM